MGIVSLKYHQYIQCNVNRASKLASVGKLAVVGLLNNHYQWC